jgi:hypothetical protein
VEYPPQKKVCHAYSAAHAKIAMGIIQSMSIGFIFDSMLHHRLERMQGIVRSLMPKLPSNVAHGSFSLTVNNPG